MVEAQRVIMVITSIAMLLLRLLHKVYMLEKAVVIDYFWTYELLFGSQQAICKRSNSLDDGFER
jgi:hypothetical protein